MTSWTKPQLPQGGVFGIQPSRPGAWGSGHGSRYWLYHEWCGRIIFKATSGKTPSATGQFCATGRQHSSTLCREEAVALIDAHIVVHLQVGFVLDHLQSASARCTAVFPKANTSQNCGANFLVSA